jgi:hypothetical protein
MIHQMTTELLERHGDVSTNPTLREFVEETRVPSASGRAPLPAALSGLVVDSSPPAEQA